MDWCEKCYSRLLIDNHITEDDPSLMTKFDPAVYVAMVKKAKIDAAMVYACCHNGNCYYPTRVGHMHRNLAGRDIFGETVDLLRSEGIVPIAYYTAVYHNQSAKAHPSWRQEDANGDQHSGRSWFSCPNSREYTEFTKSQIAEVIAYPVEGIFIDMTFWPVICFCHNCRTKYLEETGRSIPEVIDWGKEEWVGFQRTRERWMAEFAQELTDSIKAVRPGMTVTQQFSPVLAGWRHGQSPGIASACDYTGGDFYGGKYQHSFGCKVLSAFSRSIPYEFMTSRCVNLYDHTSMKSEAEMFCSVASTLANGGAFFFIDAINADGTLSEDVYDRLGRVADKAEPFKRVISSYRPVITADVGVYFSMAGHVDEADNGLDLKQPATGTSNMSYKQIPAIREMVQTSIALTQANTPHRIVTSDKLDLSGLKALIINNAMFMSEGEVERIRGFVLEGGTLIATGSTSLYNLEGKTTGDFRLADVFGVSYSGEKSESVSYLTYAGEVDTPPSGAKSGRLQYVVSDTPAPLVKVTTATSLAGVTRTHFKPFDSERFASFHSNPPGPLTEYDGLTVNTYGKGKCVYLYSSLLSKENYAQQRFGELLFRKYASSEIILDCNAPLSVEVTILKSTVSDAYLLCFVNWQAELPNIPIREMTTTLRLPDGSVPARCVRASDGADVPLEIADGAATLRLQNLDTLEILTITVEGVMSDE